MYSDNQFKFVALLNTKLPLHQLLNAYGHAVGGLVSHCPDSLDMKFLRYETCEGTAHSWISRYPIIELAANSSQIRRFKLEIRPLVDAGEVAYNDFVGTMIGNCAEEQLERTRACPEHDLEFFVAVVFGGAALIGPYTKRFSVLKTLG